MLDGISGKKTVLELAKIDEEVSEGSSFVYLLNQTTMRSAGWPLPS